MSTKLWLLGMFAVALTGCGGSTDDDGKSNSGGTSSGGTSSGGTSSGGSSSGGSSSGGTSSGGSGGSTSKACGGLADIQCAGNEFCNYPDGLCGGDDGMGICETKPNGCTDDCPGVCACDGKFYCNACGAQQAGVDDSNSVTCLPDDTDGGLKKCGGSGNAKCASDEFCEFANGCGAPGAEGMCVKKPKACDADCPGVCGCDGQFYCNECNANAAGTNASSDQSCKTGDGGVGQNCTTKSECNPGLLCCYPCGIPGCDTQCTPPQPNGLCPMPP